MKNSVMMVKALIHLVKKLKLIIVVRALKLRNVKNSILFWMIRSMRIAQNE